VSGTSCEELALRVPCTKGSGHFFAAHCLEHSTPSKLAIEKEEMPF